MSEPLLSGAELLHLERRRLDQATDAPVILAVAVVGAQLQETVGFALFDTCYLEGNAGWRDSGCLGLCADVVCRHVEAALALGVLRVGERVLLVEDDANVFAVGVLGWVAVVFDVAGR